MLPGRAESMRKEHEMRPLVRPAAALLLGAFISFSTTCGELGLGDYHRPLAADAPPSVPEALNSLASAASTESVPP
jgi:hypothetical protein